MTRIPVYRERGSQLSTVREAVAVTGPLAGLRVVVEGSSQGLSLARGIARLLGEQTAEVRTASGRKDADALPPSPPASRGRRP